MAVVLDLCRETRRRMNSVRQLALEDVDLAAGTVRWRGEFDTARETRVTPLSTRARAVILRALEQRRAEGLDASPWLSPPSGTGRRR
jgi:integrase